MKRRAMTLAAAGLAVLSAVLCGIGLFPMQQAEPAMRFESAGFPAPEIPPVERPDGTVDINSDDTDDLLQLHGVGESLAARIIEERIANGPYHYPEDLAAVSGIGIGKINGFRDQLDFSWEDP